MQLRGRRGWTSSTDDVDAFELVCQIDAQSEDADALDHAPAELVVIKTLDEFLHRGRLG